VDEEHAGTGHRKILENRHEVGDFAPNDAALPCYKLDTTSGILARPMQAASPSSFEPAGAGGLLLGPRADRHARPLVFYSYLESIVALSAAATPLLLAVARSIYLASGGSARLGGATATFIRLALSVIVLGVPTVAIGGTLPAAARAATRAIDARRRDVAALYALNTLGARRLPGRNVLVAGDVRHALDALARSGDQPARGASGAATRSIVVG